MRTQVALEALATRIGDAEGLDRVADKIKGVLDRVLVSGRLRSALSGTWLGHPVHPFLVSTPIGLWTGASTLDLVGQQRAAQTMVGAGVLSALPAAMTGLSDWSETSGAERRVGVVHIAAVSLATACYTASWQARRRQHPATGIALSIVGAVTASAGGWLGGHMAYAMGVGVDTNAFDGAPIDWTRLDLPALHNEPVRTAVGPTPLLAVQDAGTVRVLADRCSHRGASLAEGPVADGCVTCPWHGSRFDLATGRVEEGPAVVPQPVYETREADGVIEVRRSEQRALRSNTTHP